MSENAFHIVFVAVYLTFFAIRAVYHRYARQTRGAFAYREGRLNLAVRLGLAVPFMLILFGYMLFPSILAWAHVSLPEWIRWLGVGSGLTSLPLIWWVQWALGSNFDGTLHIRDNHTLVTHGPYRWVRHPMYTVMALTMISGLLISANWVIGILPLAGLLFVVVTRVEREEAALIEKFGEEYRAYMRRTGQFLPKLAR